MKKENFYSFSAKAANQTEVPLKEYKNQVILVVNVASKCGFTSQYAGLEELFRKYKNRGFSVIGFPCNQFGAQEQGSDSDIQKFCSLTYDVTFPVMAKVDVNGETATPLYKWLKDAAGGIFGFNKIKWNFTKFLIDRHGNVVKRFAPLTSPAKMTKAIEKVLSLP
jgi:glutathione peroxidase